MSYCHFREFMCSAGWIIIRNNIFKMTQPFFSLTWNSLVHWVKLKVWHWPQKRWQMNKNHKNSGPDKKMSSFSCIHPPTLNTMQKVCEAQKSEGACIELTPVGCHQCTLGIQSRMSSWQLKLTFSALFLKERFHNNLGPWFVSPTIRCIQHALTL